MNKLNIKPLSVNECWQGKRFKTNAYKVYESAVLLLLPRFELPPPPYQLYLKWGFSSSASDFDNPVKPMTDILQKKYGFNDKLIYRAIVDKTLVKKGREFIEWELTHFDEAIH